MASQEIIDMMTPAGRLKYTEIANLAKTATLSDFNNQFLYPILVGESLYQGSIEASKIAGGTMCFKAADAAIIRHKDHNTPDPSGLRRAIYPLIKHPNSSQTPNQFIIGRTDGNDMVMVDYTISRKHAQITIDTTTFKFSLIDLGSANGTNINGIPLVPKEPKPFVAGDEMGFGRFNFKFMTATELFVQLRSP